MGDSAYSSTIGWDFTAASSGSPPPPGGLVLSRVTHDGHNFAKSLRLVRLWVEIQDVDSAGKPGASKKTPYLLDAASFTVGPTTLLKPAATPWWTRAWADPFRLNASEAALQFEAYLSQDGGGSQFGLSAKYEAPALFAASANCQDAGLTVEQLFLFSRYSNDPRHEPSGALAAARCFPMIRYKIAKNPKWDKGKAGTRVASIRFDYRLHLYLDAHYDLAATKIIGDLGNQAGLFADSDSVITSAMRGSKSAANQVNAWGAQQRYWPVPPNFTAGRARAFSAASFDAAEKPLPLEVTAPGLAAGFPVFQTKLKDGTLAVIRCWDNVHWWGARGAGQPLISTPGAFHCAHLHWRWGGAGKAAPGAVLNSRFNPNTYPRGLRIPSGNSGMWGPLLDPGIFAQNVRVAVTTNRKSLDPERGAAPADMSREDWKTAFDAGSPGKIYDGDDLVLWFSVEVLHAMEFEVDDNPPFPTSTWKPQPGGTIFIHGIFFAHDAEQVGMTVGTTDPIHVPKSRATIEAEAQWFRPAQVI